MTFTVWHRDVPTFMNLTPAEMAAFPVGFSDVAVVETDDIGRVFQLTNHIDRPWWENPEVRVCVRTSRSTSVGDVIVSATGERVAVASIGLDNF